MKLAFLNPIMKRSLGFAALLIAFFALAQGVCLASPAPAYANSGTVTYYTSDGSAKTVNFNNDIAGLFNRAKSEGGKIVVDLADDWDTSNYRIEVPSNRDYTINLHGHMINRGKASTNWYGSGDQDVIVVNEGATLTVNGASSDAEKKLEHKGTLYDSNRFWKSDGKGNSIIKGGLITGGACDDQYGSGGIALKSSKAKLYVNDTTIAGNVTDTYSWFNNYGYGAGIAVHGSDSVVELSNTKVIYNHAESSGGGIYVRKADCKIKIKDGSEVSNNYSAKCGGGIYIDGNNTSLLIDSKSKVSNNTAANEGGGIYHNGKNGEVKVKDGSAISGNTSSKDGGGIYDYYNGTKFSFDASEVSGNSAGSSSNGGGIYLNDEASLSLDNGSSISKNKAKNGGGVYVDDDGTTVSLSDKSTLKENEGDSNGGAIVLADSATLTLDDSTIDSNHAASDGSGVYILNEKFTSISCTVKLNNSSNICNNKSTKTTPQGITYYSRGAGVFIQGAGTFNIVSDDNSGKICNNLASDGGAIAAFYSSGDVDYYTQGSLSTRVKGITIKNNEAKMNAGGIFYYGSLELENVDISDNKSYWRSAGTWPCEEKTLTLKGKCIVKDNYVKHEQKNLTLRGNQTINVDSSNPPTHESRIGVSLLSYSGGDRALCTSKEFTDAWKEEIGQTVVSSDNGSYAITCDLDHLYVTDEHYVSIKGTPKDQALKYLRPGEEVTLNSDDYVKYVEGTSTKYTLDYWTVDGLGETTKLDASSGSVTFTMPSCNVRLYAHYAAPVTGLDIQLSDKNAWDGDFDIKKVTASGLKVTSATGEVYELSSAKAAELMKITKFTVQGLTERKLVRFDLSLSDEVVKSFGLSLLEEYLDQAKVTINGTFKNGTAEDEKCTAKVEKTEEGATVVSVTGGLSYWPQGEKHELKINQLNINDDSQIAYYAQQVEEGSVTVPTPDAAGMRFVKWGSLPDGVTEDAKTHELSFSNMTDDVELTAYYEPLVSAVEIEVPTVSAGSAFPSSLKSFTLLEANDKDLTEAANSGVSISWAKEDGDSAGKQAQSDTEYKATITTKLEDSESYRYGFADNLVARINGKDAASVTINEKEGTQTFTYLLSTGSDAGFGEVLTDLTDESIACVADYASKLPQKAEYLFDGTVRSAEITWDTSSIDESKTSGSFTVKGTFVDSSQASHEVSKTFVLAGLGTPPASLESGTYATGSDAIKDVKLFAGDGWASFASAEIYYYVQPDSSQAGTADTGTVGDGSASDDSAALASSIPRGSFTKYTDPIAINESSTLYVYGKVGNRETDIAEYKYSIKDQYEISVSDGLARDADDHELSAAFVGDEVKVQASDAPEGKVFDKWELVSGSIADFDKLEGKEIFTFTMPAEGVSLKATYKAKPCTVTFGTDGGSSVEDQTVEYGNTAQKPADPTKEGYVFKGWKLGDKDYDFDSAVTEDIVLKASWAKDSAKEDDADKNRDKDSADASDGGTKEHSSDATSSKGADDSSDGSSADSSSAESDSGDASPETGDAGFAAVGAFALGSLTTVLALRRRKGAWL